MHRLPRVIVVLMLALAACTTTESVPTPGPSGGSSGPPSPSVAASPAATPQGSLSREQAWADDLARIVPGLERIHPNPFHGTSRADMEAAVADLASRAASLSDDELMVGVLRIAALVSANGFDGHTGAFPWGAGTYPVDSLPLRLWLFGEDLVVVDALPPYEHLVGAGVDSVEGHPIADVRARLDPLIPRDNDQTVRLLTPRYLLIPQVLRGLGLADDGPVTLGFGGVATPGSVAVDPVAMAAYNAWAGAYGLHLPADPDVPYLSRIDEDLWWELLPDGTLYVQYNRVERLGAVELTALRQAMTASDVDRVVLDIRHNTGGEVPMVEAMMGILDDPAIDQPGRLFVVVGRNTWSAGSLLLARLEARTDAVLIGEPMAGQPTFYGDIVQLSLPHSGLVLLVAEMLEVGVDPADTRPNIELDVEAELTQQDWEAGRDPALESIVAVAP